MAEKRAFAAEILESDAFSSLSAEAKLLYIFINMESDDDGVCSKVRMAAVLADIGDRKALVDELIASGFLIPVKNCDRVIVTHWHVHNSIRSDMYKPTLYQDDFNEIYIQPGKRGADLYTLRNTGIPAKRFFEKSKSSIAERTEKKEAFKESSINEERIIEFQRKWNEITGIKRIKNPETITKQRLESFADLYDKYGESAGQELLDQIRKSDFLCGRVGREGSFEKFVVTIDWVLKPENTEKILNGNYDNCDEHQPDNPPDDEISKLY